MANERWEKVHTVSRYWNGPILGVADLDGVPHIYEKFSSKEENDNAGRYRVMSIDQQLHALLMERWSIFVRWRTAHPGRKLEAVPALPEDRDRYSYLADVIGNREKPHPDQSRILDTRFRRTSSGPSYVLTQWEVQWLDQAAAPKSFRSERGRHFKDEDRALADSERSCKQCGHPSDPHLIIAFDVGDFSKGGVMRCPVEGCNCESTISFNLKLS